MFRDLALGFTYLLKEEEREKERQREGPRASGDFGLQSTNSLPTCPKMIGSAGAGDRSLRCPLGHPKGAGGPVLGLSLVIWKLHPGAGPGHHTEAL